MRHCKFDKQRDHSPLMSDTVTGTCTEDIPDRVSRQHDEDRTGLLRPSIGVSASCWDHVDVRALAFLWLCVFVCELYSSAPHFAADPFVNSEVSSVACCLS